MITNKNFRIERILVACKKFGAPKKIFFLLFIVSKHLNLRSAS